MQTITPEVKKATEEVQEQKQADKEKARVMRHVARPAVRVMSFVLSPEKRTYMKQFGSRAKKNIIPPIKDYIE